MVISLLKKYVLLISASIYFLSFGLTSCNGVHNEPPSEIVRTSGAGPSSRVSSGTANVKAIEDSQKQVILDSSGNPVNTAN